MAALTMSFDRDACRYAAAVQTNGHRVEMITTNNIQSMMMPLFDRWITKVGGGKTGTHSTNSSSFRYDEADSIQVLLTFTTSVMVFLRVNMPMSSTRKSPT